MACLLCLLLAFIHPRHPMKWANSLHLAHEDTKAQRGSITCPNSPTRKWLTWSWILDPPDSEACAQSSVPLWYARATESASSPPTGLCAVVFPFIENMIIFTLCLADADSSSFEASIFFFFFCSNQMIFAQLLLFVTAPAHSRSTSTEEKWKVMILNHL